MSIFFSLYFWRPLLIRNTPERPHCDPARATALPRCSMSAFSPATSLFILETHFTYFSIATWLLFSFSQILILRRHYLMKFKMNCCPVEVLFVILFVGLRFWFGADVMLFVIQNEEVPQPFKVGIVIIYFMSCGLLPGVIRMLLSSNRKLEKKKSQTQSRVVRHHFVTTLTKPYSSKKNR